MTALETFAVAFRGHDMRSYFHHHHEIWSSCVARTVELVRACADDTAHHHSRLAAAAVLSVAELANADGECSLHCCGRRAFPPCRLWLCGLRAAVLCVVCTGLGDDRCRVELLLSETRAAINAAGGIVGVVAAMSGYADQPGVQEAGCTALWNLSAGSAGAWLWDVGD